MKKVFKQVLCMSVCICLVGSFLTACGSDMKESGTETFGRVTALSDSEITLAVFERQQMPEQSGKPDDKEASGDGEMPKGERPEGTPLADVSGAAIGQRPEKVSGGAADGNSANQETKSFQLDGNVTYYKQQGEETTEIAASELELGSMVTIVSDGDTVISVTVQSMKAGQRGGERAQRQQTAKEND